MEMRKTTNASSGILVGICLATVLVGLTSSAAANCRNPNALGTSRTITVDPFALPRISWPNSPHQLALKDGEVVLSFDDGPLPPHTEKVLNVLAAECVKATFFIVGKMANDTPALVRRAHAEGRAIGTHTQTHPHLPQLSFLEAKKEIENGMASVAAALGKPQALAPFFRPPYLESTHLIDGYLAARGIMSWGTDFDSDDWKDISADEVVQRSLNGLAEKRKGILLMHDIQPTTVQALPILLRELKRRNYRIVHVVATNSAQLGQ